VDPCKIFLVLLMRLLFLCWLIGGSTARGPKTIAMRRNYNPQEIKAETTEERLTPKRNVHFKKQRPRGREERNRNASQRQQGVTDSATLRDSIDYAGSVWRAPCQSGWPKPRPNLDTNIQVSGGGRAGTRNFELRSKHLPFVRYRGKSGAQKGHR